MRTGFAARGDGMTTIRQLISAGALATASILSTIPNAAALDSFASVEQFLDMERDERFTFMIGALDVYATLGGAGLYRSRDFHMRISRLLDCAHSRPVDELLADITREAENEPENKAYRTAMASALPRYLGNICEPKVEAKPVKEKPSEEGKEEEENPEE
jgi:hypothetical protein